VLRLIALAGVAGLLCTGHAGARPLRSGIVNEQFYLAMTVKGCPCKGKLAGTFSGLGTVSERGTIKGTFMIRNTLAVPTLSGTTTLAGSHGTITIAYTGRLVATSQRHPDGSSDYGIGIGTWKVNAATGSYAHCGRARGSSTRRSRGTSSMPATCPAE
jgi:hypothetical protein